MGRKFKRCFIWIDSSRLEDLESWFTDMSSKGWEFKAFNAPFVIFEKCVPQNKIYRIEIIEQKDQTLADRIDLYCQAGWEYVASNRMLHIFRANSNANIIEIHTDPIEQADSIRTLQKRIILYSILMLIDSFFGIGLSVCFYWFDKVGFYTETYKFLSTFITLLCYIYICYFLLQSVVNIRALVKKLKSGKYFEHRSNYRRRMKRRKATMISAFSTAILYFALMIACIIPHQKYFFNNPPIPNASLPVLRLENIIPDQKLIPDPFIDPDGDFSGDMDNYFKRNWSILLPIQYELKQEDSVTEIEGSDNKTKTDESSITSDEYQAITPLVARMFYQVLLNNYKNGPVYGGDYTFFNIQSETFDSLWEFDEKDISSSHIFLALKGDRIYTIDVTSTVPADKIISLLEQKAQQK